MAAPVCQINPVSPTPHAAPVLTPSIPPAVDLTSALLAINAIRQFIIALTNQTSSVGGGGGALASGSFPGLQQGNLVGALGGQVPRGSPGNLYFTINPSTKGKASSFRMIQDVQVPVKLTSEDGSVTIDLTQTNRLILVNDVTQETWIFQRPGT